MSSEFGQRLKISVFGQSHGKAIGCVIDGLPAGESIDMHRLQQFMARRRPGQGTLTTARNEGDVPIFLSGIENSRTCAAPVCAIIENSDMHSKDYDALLDVPRPGHADFTAAVKYGGHADMRGGGHFSGRLTAPLCIAGGIALQLLERHGIHIAAHLAQVGAATDRPFPLEPTPAHLAQLALTAPLPVLDPTCGDAMATEIHAAREAGDSIGGMVEGIAIGLPTGLGNPMFDGVENRLAAALFGIPGVKGVSFGAGFAVAGMRGSVCNDPFVPQDSTLRTTGNHHGGVLGGITSGMPLLVQVAMKPTPSIARPQQSVRLSDHQPTELVIHGRHDPCIAVRAVPVVEAVLACVILDLLLEEPTYGPV